MVDGGMTESRESYTSKVGAKGQVVIYKELRDRHGIKPGVVVEQVETREGILIRRARLLEDWRALALRVGEKWPKGVTSVQAVREDRER